jgi:membrane-bound lytic murein transglycosylase B
MKQHLVAAGCLGAATLAGIPVAGLVGMTVVISGVLGGGAGASGPPPAAGAVPAEYSSILVEAARRYQVPWQVLAGIYKVECDFGRSPDAGCNPPGSENAAGAQGPGQFLPSTWRRSLGPHQLIPPGPPTTDAADGYATDGDGDGIADPWDPADAVASTARLLASDGATDAGSVALAIFAYNHDPAYVREVLAYAAAYAAAQTAVSAPLRGPSQDRPS